MAAPGPDSMGAGPLNPTPIRSSARRFHKNQQCFQWSRVHVSPDSIVPPPRSGAASVVVQGKLYMFGGYGGGTGRLDDFYSYDFKTQTWEEVRIVGSEKPGCRENNGVVISDSSKSIYLFGGYNGTAWLNDLWKFDIQSKKWTCLQGSSDPNPLENDIPLGRPRGDQQEVDNSLGGVQVTRGRVPSRRFGYVSVVHENKLVLFGGFDGNRWLNDMFVFDFDTKSWVEVHARGVLPSVRSCPAWAKDDTHVYIQGGYDGVERKDDFFACDLSTYTWTQMPSLGSTPSPRYFHSCCLYGNKMYLYGGYSGTQRLADMHAYDFETNTWSQVDTNVGDVPSGRSSLVAQVYENKLYIFGGYNGSTVLNDFYQFRLRPIEIPPTGLVNDFSQLVDNAEMSDVCFRVEGRVVHGNRAILAIRSEYFRALLFNGYMRESVRAGSEEEPIEIDDVSHTVFLKILEYLYTDSVRNVTMEIGIHLLIASEHFMLDRLKSLCEDNIRRDINVHNVIQILVASHQHNASALKEIALDFILRNLTEKVVQKGLSELKAEPDLLVEIIRLSSTALPSLNSPSPVSSPGLRQGYGRQPAQNAIPFDQVYLQHPDGPNMGPFGPANDWGAR